MKKKERLGTASSAEPGAPLLVAGARERRVSGAGCYWEGLTAYVICRRYLLLAWVVTLWAWAICSII